MAQFQNNFLCSLDDPLPKLLKWFPSAEQNGHQSLKIEKPVKTSPSRPMDNSKVISQIF